MTIIKICKKHGLLSPENIYKRKGRKGKPLYVCYICMKERWGNYYKNNKEKALKSNLEYSRKNKDKIKEIRDRTRKKNRIKQNEHNRLKHNKGCEELDDNYLKMILCRFGNLTYADITKEMIFFKRIALMIKRKICEIKYGSG